MADDIGSRKVSGIVGIGADEEDEASGRVAFDGLGWCV